MSLRNILPVIALAVVALFVMSFSDAGTSSITNQIASSTPATATSSVPVVAVASSTPEATTTEKGVPAVPAIPTLSTEQINSKNLTAAGGELLKSVVNIICLPHDGSPLKGISGSGVIIDSRGLILTAAHVGQYFLLRDYPKAGSVSCVIRSGSPARTAYTADAVYVSPSWVEANPDTLSEAAPRGTGENDFAILAITGSASGTSLPPSLPAIPLGTGDPVIGEPVAIGAYAAQFLGTSQIEHDLYSTIVFGTISDRLTFETGSIDVVAVAGTPAAQEGSSGGGLADSSGHLIGLITTSTITGDASERTLHAITPFHIRASFAADSHSNLDTYLSGNSLATLVDNFRDEASHLKKILVASLNSH